MSETIEFHDRYSALGIPRPDPATMCRGECEGTGWVPIKNESRCKGAIPGVYDAELKKRWRETHSKVAWWKRLAWWLRIIKFDGWHFVVCPRCEGTRLEPIEQEAGE